MGHFQKSETGSESMSRSVMASSLKKNGLKKCSSLTNDWVIDVWSQCKKRDGGKGRGEGPARVWGFDYVNMSLTAVNKFHSSKHKIPKVTGLGLQKIKWAVIWMVLWGESYCLY